MRDVSPAPANGAEGSPSVVGLALDDALIHWKKANLDQLHTVSVKYFLDRAPHPIEVLRNIKCPITLVQSGADIAYPIELTQELLARLEEAGVDARIKVVKDAPHFATVTHATE